MGQESGVHSILVVDDSEFFRSELIGFLSLQRGWKVVGEARSGAEAIHLARILRPDLVLMDIHMPIMDGIEATIYIKRKVGRQMRIVLLSMYESATGLELSSQVLADGYVSKQEIRRELPRILKHIGEEV